MYARDILSHPVVKVWPVTALHEAISLFAEHGFSALPVVDESDHVVGMLSESDALAAEARPRDTAVADLMTTPAQVIEPDTAVTTIAARMLSLHLRSMPVVEAGVLVGIVARHDLLRALAHPDAAVEAEIRALLDRYAGSRRRWTITVADGHATVRGEFTDTAEQRTVSELALSVEGVDNIEVTADHTPPTNHEAMSVSQLLHSRAEKDVW
jgi:CBS domain-containing protein